MKFKVLLLSLLAVLLLITGCDQENTDVPEGMKLFSNEHVDYTAFVPEDWTVDMSTGTLSAYVSSTDASGISITANILEYATTLDEYWKSYEEDFESTFSEMEYLENQPTKTTLDGIEANQYVFTASVTGNTYKYMQTVCINKGNIYVITYTSTEELYEEHIDDIDKIIKNFKFN